jgi:GT2 family glycosyltransferase
MKVAVITVAHLPVPVPYLDKCINSVRAQTYPDIHHIVVNDGAEPYTIPGVEVINLPTCHNDFGDTPRAIGAASAIGQGYDAIAWLDYDNWYEPNHIQSLVECLTECGASIACSSRWLSTMEEEKIGQCYEVDGINFVDANCYLIGKQSFKLAWKWLDIPGNNH